MASVTRSNVVSYGLPTRSFEVSEFMIGLAKTKARAGEVSQSVRALTQDDMYHLHKICIAKKGLSDAERRAGVVRYVSLPASPA